MLEQYYTREYLYDEGDGDTGFVLTSDATSNFYFCKIEQEEDIERFLSGCMINFDNCDDKIEEITFKHLRKLLRGEDDSWVIDRIIPRPGKMRVEIEVPELRRLFELYLEEYFSEEVCRSIDDAVESWFNGKVFLDFSFSESWSVRFYKTNRRGVIREYRFHISSQSDWNKESVSLRIRNRGGHLDEKEYNFRWKDEKREDMIAEITESAEL